MPTAPTLREPTPFINLFQMFLIFVIPAGLTYTLGRMTGSPGHGWAVLAAMFVLFAAGFTAVYWAESHPHLLIHGAAADPQRTPPRPATWRAKRSATASPKVLALRHHHHRRQLRRGQHHARFSFTPLGGMVVLLNIMFGCIVFGGVGAGLYGMIIMVVLSVFIAGLMVGRTPEYLGKKIEAYDMKMTMLYVLIFPLIILTGTAVFVLSPTIGLSSLGNQGPHGFTEILYAFSSAAANNGSAFGGLNANTWWYNVMLGFTMLGGRFLMMVPMLALAGNLASKKSVPPSPGTFPVNTALFATLLVGVILIVSALTFFPALSLGPILEHLQLHAGQLF
jgi:K+-transporting ATPase ATPase A chain